MRLRAMLCVYMVERLWLWSGVGWAWLGRASGIESKFGKESCEGGDVQLCGG